VSQLLSSTTPANMLHTGDQEKLAQRI